MTSDSRTAVRKYKYEIYESKHPLEEYDLLILRVVIVVCLDTL